MKRAAVARVRSFGELIAEGRKRAKLTQRELAARIKVEEGRSISAPYLNDLEHNLRKPPRGHLIEQFAKELNIAPDLLYFAARRMPDDVEAAIPEDQILAAYRAFRKELKARKR